MAILSLVNKSVMNKNFFVKSCIEHEANAWIDNLSIDIIDEVQASFEECKGTFLDFVIPIRMAWNEKIGTDRRMPDLQFTPLLMKSIESLEKKTGNVCDRFSLLVATVAEQCLLSQTEPLPLAVIVVRLAGRGPMEHLANYATQLIERLPREQAKPPEDDLSYGEQNCLRAMHLLIFPLEYDDKTISDNIISAETRKKAHLSTIQRIAAKTACYDMVSSPFCLQMISRTLHLLSQSDHADGASAEMAPGLYFVLRICMVAAFQVRFRYYFSIFSRVSSVACIPLTSV